ncbi:hypothetical protein [Magnetospira sp. QH-2]|uniref:hypothetical protein n=1 Tax=Magnetospira sp. (strain QH-2) TaxID=1288970 RepID=UPI0003E80DB6|nr:hypothetical protein [Magnetospira sp. QH-2]CCQ72876.1 Conserved exported protein of unknown function, Tat signal [Magnetospira sp. QH-2]
MENKDTSQAPTPEVGDSADQKLVDGGSKLKLRRRFMTGSGALVTAPVVMSLASRSAFAEVCTPSAYASALADVTRSAGNEQDCNGLSPGGWKNTANETAKDEMIGGSGNDDLSTQVAGSGGNSGCENASWAGISFSATFGGVWMDGSGYWNSDKTLCEALWLDGNEDRYQFAAHIIAAYLNASGYDPSVRYVMTSAQVADMGRQIVTTGRYSVPAIGIDWDAQTVVAFIQQTFH